MGHYEEYDFTAYVKANIIFRASDTIYIEVDDDEDVKEAAEQYMNLHYTCSVDIEYGTITVEAAEKDEDCVEVTYTAKTIIEDSIDFTEEVKVTSMESDIEHYIKNNVDEGDLDLCEIDEFVEIESIELMSFEFEEA